MRHRIENKDYLLKTYRSSAVSSDLCKAEFRVISSLRSESLAPAIKVLNVPGGLAILFRDLGRCELKEFLSSRKINLKQKIQLAINICKAVEFTHQAQFILGGLSLQSILVQAESLELSLVDFGVCKSLNPQDQESGLAGSPDPSFVSPEQTGRINRETDYRSDFYSFGVLLYYIFTSRLPFEGDKVQLLHAHIAKHPPSMSSLVPALPPSLDKIVRKLMEKDRADRYQSSFGILWDLSHLMNLSPEDMMEPFPIARRDISQSFVIPHSLVGRDREVELLRSSYRKARSGDRQLLVVEGPSGVGKSRLVEELAFTELNEEGIFIAGKFDQFDRSVPFSALKQALERLVQHIMSFDASSFRDCQSDLIESLGINGQIILDLCPSFELIIGKQPVLQELNPQEAQMRHDNTLMKFFASLASRQHPLVIFFDDVQWGDAATLQVIDLIFKTNEDLYILVIVSFREDEILEDHRIFQIIRDVPSEQKDHVLMEPLSFEAILSLVEETLHRSDVDSLAKLIFDKAHGNPFFTREYFERLHNEGLIVFDKQQGQWQYDMNALYQFDVSDNVIDLVQKRLRSLSEDMQSLLKIGSVLGQEFLLSDLAIIKGASRLQVADVLSKAIEYQVLIPLSDAIYLANDNDEIVYRFLHDRIQQAAYEMIEGRELGRLHLKVARLFWDNSGDKHRVKLVRHYNKAIDLVEALDERERVYRLNLEAAKQAKKSGAFEAALGFLGVADSIIPSIQSEIHSVLFDFYKHYMDVAFFDKNITLAEKNFDQALKQKHSRNEEADLYYLRGVHYENLFHMDLALESLSHCLSILGYRVAKAVNPIKLGFELMRGIRNIFRFSKLDRLPIPSAEQRQQSSLVQKALMSLGLNAYMLNKPEMASYVAFLSFNLSFRKGRTEELAYSMCGVYAALRFIGFDRLATRVAKLIPQEIEKIDSLFLKSRSLYSYVVLIHHWYVPFHDLEKHYEELIHLSREAGDQLAESVAVYMMFYFVVNDFELASAVTERSINRIKNSLNREYYYATLLTKAIHTSLGSSERDPNLSLAEISSDDLFQNLKTDTNRAYFYFGELYLNYLYGNFEKAFEAVRQAIRLRKSIVSILTEPYIYSFSLLICLEYQKIKPRSFQVRLYRWHIEAKLKKWVKYKPYVLDRFRSLFEPSLQRSNMDRLKSLEKFQIFASTRGLEPTAQFHTMAFRMTKDMGLEQLSLYHLREAIRSWEAIGASGISAYLRGQSPTDLDLVDHAGLASKKSNHRDESDIDIDILEQAQRTFSEKLNSQDFVERSVELLKTTVGANQGHLLERDSSTGEHVLRYSQIHGEKTFPNLSLEESTLSTNVRIHQVIRSLKPIVDSPDDRQSILVIPVIHYGQLVRVFYLENDHVGGAFDQHHLRLASLLSHQISALMGYMNLSEDMERRVYEKTGDIKAILEHINQGILIFNASDLSVTAECSISIGDILGVESFVGRNAIDILFQKSDVSPQIRLAISDMIRSRDLDPYSLVHEMTFHLSEDNIRYLDLDWAPILNADDDMLKVLVTIRDVTSLKRLEAIEAETAQVIQRSLLSSRSSFGDTLLASYYQAAETVGGDWFSTFFHEESQRLYLLIGDVTGHGVGSALVTGAVAGASHMAFAAGEDISRIPPKDFLNSLASKLNHVVSVCGADGARLMTMAMICFDLREGSFHYLNAGHNSILRVGNRGHGLLLKGGTPLGLDDPQFGYEEGPIVSDDIFFLYTDGLIEQPGPSGKTLSLRQINRLISHGESAEFVRNKIKNLVEDTWQGQQLDDDCTFIVLKIGSCKVRSATDLEQAG
ncbi:Predicted ATPase [Pseudobacteriovorax antillogorgiicola]|uniref:Predicted ATPase n=2 Tax=Pseudobacteriovorax antillogorgiicola TaxID=1513793 RepID=A0A1Y6CR46_9BACT|nr:putative ATPase [Pseudobacteriovorax antillogorgiicola]SMF72788.1 Predicted ATPase [Pseudobacteriovorax antillogorgiicola]